MYKLTLLSPKNLINTSSLEKQKSYVGIDLEEYYFNDDNLNHQFLNGASLKGCLFQSKEIRHTEMREATFQECQFLDCDLTSSDLVYSKFINCVFINCQFSNGEWIESEFTSCQFNNSIFNHTTINLCSFTRCRLDSSSFSGLHNQSVQFNMFNDCEFDNDIELGSVIDRNFGIKTLVKIDITDKTKDLFVYMSRLFFSNQLLTNDFINISSQIVEQLLVNSNRAYLLRIKYLSLICSTYISYMNVSPLGIKRLEIIITKKIEHSNSNNRGLYTELVLLIMTIRLMYADRISEIELKMFSLKDTNDNVVKSSILYFTGHYSESQVQYIQDYIASYCNIKKSLIQYRINHGSTEIVSEILSQASLQLPIYCLALLSFLKGVEVTTKTVSGITKHIVDIKKNIADMSLKNNQQNTNQLTKVKQNTINALKGADDTEISRKIIEFARNECSEKVLEMEDNAKLEITIDNSNILESDQ